MKKIYFIFILLLFLSGLRECLAQIPTYNLTVKNLQYYGCPSNTLEFDIYIQHTNSPTVFLYGGGQFFFNFNQAIANGGTLTYQKVGSDLPSYMHPVNPQVSGSQLRLAVNAPPGFANAPNLTGTIDTKIVRMRLTTSANSFATVPLNLSWRDQNSGNPYTKIFAYIGTTGTDITTDNTHIVDNFFTNVCEKFLLDRPLFNSPTNFLPVTFSWSSASQAIYYKLQVSADQNFSSYVFNDSGIVDTFKTIGGLNESTRYYWRVLARNNTNYYLTSQTWYFNTGFVNNSQVPTYNLSARNFTLNSPDDNQLEFDIYLEHTNYPATLEYAMGQFFFDFNPDIANGGTLTYSIVSSDLPANLQPRNPIVSGSQLNLAANTPPSPGFGFNMTNNGFPGTKIVRMRLATSASQFANVPLNLLWRNTSGNGFYTKIFAYVGQIGQEIFSEITTPLTHTVNYNFLLPVELVNFSSVVDRNNAVLYWITSNEINNRSFEIERSITNGVWTNIGYVEGSGNSTEEKDYTFTDRGLNYGKYNYRLKQIDYNGNFEYFYLSNEVSIGLPSNYNLSQNYPNPFNPSTKINFDLPAEGIVKILIYDMSGREIKVLVNEFKTAGYHAVNLDGSNFSSGIYFYRLTSNNFSETKKMMLVK